MVFFIDAWEHVEYVSIRQAACLLIGVENIPASNRMLPSAAEAMLEALRQAVIVGRISPHAAFAWAEGDMDSPSPIAAFDISPYTRLADCTTVLVNDLVRWCDSKGIDHFWESRRTSAIETVAEMPSCPQELRAAIEAFTAVHSNPALTAARSPKAALLTWLEQHKSELTSNARERVATVANWQPVGGAPKTPGA
jgi:hypothetical protein